MLGNLDIQQQLNISWEFVDCLHGQIPCWLFSTLNNSGTFLEGFVEVSRDNSHVGNDTESLSTGPHKHSLTFRQRAVELIPDKILHGPVVFKKCSLKARY